MVIVAVVTRKALHKSRYQTNDVINLMRDIPVVVVVGSASGGENNKTTSG